LNTITKTEILGASRQLDIAKSISGQDVSDDKIWLELHEDTIYVELTTIYSNHHVELSPNDAGFEGSYVVQEIIKEMDKNRPIEVNVIKGFKVLFLNEVYNLSKKAQNSL
jgi:replication factor C subunit 3/5